MSVASSAPRTHNRVFHYIHCHTFASVWKRMYTLAATSSAIQWQGRSVTRLPMIWWHTGDTLTVPEPAIELILTWWVIHWRVVKHENAISYFAHLRMCMRGWNSPNSRPMCFSPDNRDRAWINTWNHLFFVSHVGWTRLWLLCAPHSLTQFFPSNVL